MWRGLSDYKNCYIKKKKKSHKWMYQFIVLYCNRFFLLCPFASYAIGIPFCWAIHRKGFKLLPSDSLYIIAILYNLVTSLQTPSVPQASIDLLSINWPRSYRKTQILDILMRISDPFQLSTWPVSVNTQHIYNFITSGNYNQ